MSSPQALAAYIWKYRQTRSNRSAVGHGNRAAPGWLQFAMCSAASPKSPWCSRPAQFDHRRAARAQSSRTGPSPFPALPPRTYSFGGRRVCASARARVSKSWPRRSGVCRRFCRSASTIHFTRCSQARPAFLSPLAQEHVGLLQVADDREAVATSRFDEKYFIETVRRPPGCAPVHRRCSPAMSSIAWAVCGRPGAWNSRCRGQHRDCGAQKEPTRCMNGKIRRS